MASQFSPTGQAWLTNKPVASIPANSNNPSISNGFSSNAQQWLTTNTSPKPAQPSTSQVVNAGVSAALSIFGGVQSGQIQANTSGTIQNGKITPTPAKVNPMAQTANNIVNASEKAVQSVPEAHFADKMSMFTPNGFIANLVQGALNTPKQAVQGAMSIGENAAAGTSTPQNVSGNIAAAVPLPLLFLGGSSVAEKGIVGVAKTLGIGAGFGALGGLQSGKQITNVNDYIKNLVTNIGIGIGTAGVIHTGMKAVNLALPLAKGLPAQLGAVFIKNADKTPAIAHIEMAPQVAQSVVLANNLEKTAVGKAIVKESIAASQTEQHILLTPSENGQYELPQGGKVDIATVKPYDPTQVHPVPESRDLGITPAEKLAPEDKIIQSNFSDYLSKNYSDAVQKYNSLPETDGGKVLNTDSARELDPSYVQDRSKSAAVHEPASAFIKQLYKDKLKEPVTEGKDAVLFTAGGTGAGKSSALEIIPEIKQIKDKTQFVYDTNSSTPETAIGKMQQALDSGRKVAVVYVHRDPVEAFNNGTLPRAMRIGRTVPLEEHLNTHVGALDSIFKIEKHFKNNPNVGIEVVDNSHGKENAHVVPLDNLRSLKYNKDELRNQLHESLNKQYETNKISDKVYTATKGESRPSPIQRTSASDGASNGEKSQSESSSRTEGRNNATEPTKGNTTARSSDNAKATNGSNRQQVKPQTGEPTNQQPVGTGKLRESQAYKHTAERLMEEDPERFKEFKNGQPFYNTSKANVQAELATKFIEQDPQKAYGVAMGYENPPEGLKAVDVAIALSDRAKAEKNDALMTKLEVAESLRATREGQNIAALKGRNTANSPHVFIQQLMSERLKQLGKAPLTDAINMVRNQIPGVSKVTTSAKERGIARIDYTTEKLQKELKREQTKIQSAQNILDMLTCK